MYGAQAGWLGGDALNSGPSLGPWQGAEGLTGQGSKVQEDPTLLASSFSEESSAFHFFDHDLPQPPAGACTPTLRCEDAEVFSEEECTGRLVLREDGAESISPCPLAAGWGVGAAAAPPSDPFLSPELMDMLRLALEREADLALEPNYLRNHDEGANPESYINAEMRKLTVGWMGEVVREYGLGQETLFLAVAIFDRFLSCSSKVPRICLQLVAVACVQIASKSEEVLYPSVKSFTYISGNAFSPADLVRTESLVLRCLGWRVQLPTSHAFLSLFKHALGMAPQTVALACYLLELCQLEYSALAYRPSQMAAAASLLAMLHYNQPTNMRALARASCSSLFELKGCLELMLILQKSALLAPPATPSAVVREEYRSPKWLGAACVTPFDSLPPAVRALHPGDC